MENNVAVSEFVECALEGTVNSKPCTGNWGTISDGSGDERTVGSPAKDHKEYDAISEASMTCIEGAFWLGAYIRGYDYDTAKEIFLTVEYVFRFHYNKEMFDINDDESNWIDSDGRDVALSMLKELRG